MKFIFFLRYHISSYIYIIVHLHQRIFYIVCVVAKMGHVENATVFSIKYWWVLFAMGCWLVLHISRTGSGKWMDPYWLWMCTRHHKTTSDHIPVGTQINVMLGTAHSTMTFFSSLLNIIYLWIDLRISHHFQIHYLHQHQHQHHTI